MARYLFEYRCIDRDDRLVAEGMFIKDSIYIITSPKLETEGILEVITDLEVRYTLKNIQLRITNIVTGSVRCYGGWVGGPSDLEKDFRFPAGLVFHVSGDSCRMGISDYNVRVYTYATVVEQPNKKSRKVLVCLDDIDHDTNVNVYINKNELIHRENCQHHDNKRYEYLKQKYFNNEVCI